MTGISYLKTRVAKAEAAAPEPALTREQIEAMAREHLGALTLDEFWEVCEMPRVVWMQLLADDAGMDTHYLMARIDKMEKMNGRQQVRQRIQTAAG